MGLTALTPPGDGVDFLRPEEDALHCLAHQEGNTQGKRRDVSTSISCPWLISQEQGKGREGGQKSEGKHSEETE